jgi:hypothetical protein
LLAQPAIKKLKAPASKNGAATQTEFCLKFIIPFSIYFKPHVWGSPLSSHAEVSSFPNYTSGQNPRKQVFDKAASREPQALITVLDFADSN